MLKKDESIEHIEEWSSKHEAEVQENDAPVEHLQKGMKELKEIENKERKAEEDQIEEKHLQRRCDEEKRLETMKIELPQTFIQKNEANSGKQTRENRVKVKLSKLIIRKFEGTNLDCLRFWSQFETEIDRVDITTVSKFSYLKEFFIPKVRALINVLPFNTEGYERAKTILKAKFGKPNVVTNAHIQCLMSLPNITQSSVGKIHDFYEKLVTHSQALDIMGKLKEING